MRTFFCRYWLFGEKKRDNENEKQMRKRGWFPRPCAIEVIENGAYSSALTKLD